MRALRMIKRVTPVFRLIVTAIVLCVYPVGYCAEVPNGSTSAAVRGQTKVDPVNKTESNLFRQNVGKSQATPAAAKNAGRNGVGSRNSGRSRQPLGGGVPPERKFANPSAQGRERENPS